MEEDFKIVDNLLWIRMPEELDHHKSIYIRENADRFMLDETVKNIVFDFSDTKFMDSSGIGVIAGRYKKIACFGGKVMAVHANERIRKVIKISGLSNILEVVE